MIVGITGVPRENGMKSIKVYIDTNVFKFAATQLPRLLPRQQTVNWGGRVHEVTVHDFVHINPNDAIQNPRLKAEAELLPVLAEHGKRGQVNYVIQAETLLESWGIPNMDSTTGKFFGTPFKTVEAPITYSRVFFGDANEPKDQQFEFLTSIESARFAELQKMTGAYQGERELNRNQLLDAFHLWSAEHNECEYFLTLDFKLMKILRQRRGLRLNVDVVCPSELLTAIRGDT